MLTLLTRKQLMLNLAILTIAIVAGAGSIYAVYAETTDTNCPTALTTFYRDADGDTYGNPSITTLACTKPDGYVANSTDCDDTVAAINPAASETCNNIDDNCSGTVDEGLASTTFYYDNDLDTYGGSATTTLACAKPDHYSANNTDCNDFNSAVKPGATEVCNAIDDNCNGTIDEGVKTTFYYDYDGDTYAGSATTTQSCSAPSGYYATHNDCNDYNSSIRPGATELNNNIDDDCDGTTDEGFAANTFYRDYDGDLYGNATNTIQAETAPSGYVSNSTDCNDYKAAIRPGATEVCDGVDNDCDGSVDENGLNTYYRDSDGDSYGNSSLTSQACSAPSGYVSNSTDCNDSNSAIRPGATELCNSIDDNCNGTVDENCQNGGTCPNNGSSTNCKCSCTCSCTCDNTANNNNCNNANNSGCGCNTGGNSCLAHLTNLMKWKGEITGKIKGQIMSQRIKITEINKDTENNKYEYKYEYTVKNKKKNKHND